MNSAPRLRAILFNSPPSSGNRGKKRPAVIIQAWQRSLELYNQGARSKDDERMRDIRRKIERAKEEVGGR